MVWSLLNLRNRAERSAHAECLRLKGLEIPCLFCQVHLTLLDCPGSFLQNPSLNAGFSGSSCEFRVKAWDLLRLSMDVPRFLSTSHLFQGFVVGTPEITPLK